MKDSSNSTTKEVEKRDPADSKKDEDPEDPQAEFSKKQVLGRLIQYSKCEFYAACVSAFINGIFFCGFAVGFKYALEWLSEIQYKTGKEEMPDVAIKIAALFAGLGVVSGLFMFLQMAMFVRVGMSISCSMRNRYYAALLRQDITFHDKTRSSQLNASLAADAALVNVGVGTQFGLTVQHLGEFFGGFGYSFYESPRVTGFMFALMPVLMAIGWIQGKITSATTNTEDDAFASIMGESGETLGGLRTVQSLNAENEKVEYFKSAVNARAYEIRGGAWRLGLGMGFFIFGTFALVYGPAFTFGAFQIDDGNLTIDELMASIFGVLIGGMGLGQIGASWPDIEKGLKAAYRMFKVIDRSPEIRLPNRGSGKTSGIEGQLEFRGVTFAYPTRKDINVYDSMDCNIKLGSTVAFCGPTGCGKSTIVNLIERFYDPDAGQILLDGVEIHEYDLKYLRSQISLVSQEPVLFDASIRDNIALGVTRKVTEEEIIYAAKRANAHDFIDSFPQKYDTRVGEGGSQMSGGQKQRIAIARAILKKSKIILLDEATSALDTKSEKIVQDALDKMIESHNCTCVVIAHRLSTIQNADVIIVLENGKIVEKGTHHELMKLQRVYAHMVDAQSMAMQEGELSVLALTQKTSSNPGPISNSDLAFTAGSNLSNVSTLPDKEI